VNAYFWNNLHSEQPTIPCAFIDVRDVAIAFIQALDKDVPTGTEYILSSKAFNWQDVVDFVKSRYPAVEVKLTPPFNIWLNVDNEPAERDLDMRWRSMETLAGSVVDQQLALRG
jgi:nucleoside-diphosphate-sugar epimerase